MIRQNLKILLIFFVIPLGILFAQNTRIDSLKEKIASSSGVVLVDLYNDLASELYNGSIEMLTYSQNAEEIAGSLKYNDGLAKAFLNQGNYYLLNDDNDKALEKYRKSLEYVNNNDFEQTSKVYERMGTAYLEAKKFDQAKEYYKKSIALLDKFPLQKFHAQPNNSLGLLYWRISEFDSALTYYSAALEVAKTFNDSSYLGRLFNNMGIIYWQWSLYDRAIENYLKSLDIRYALKDSIGIGKLLNNIGLTYMETSSFAKAREYFAEAMEISRLINNDELKGYSYYNIGNSFLKEEKLPEAYNAYQLSRKYYKLDGIESGDLLTLIQLGSILNKQNKPDSAIVFLKEAASLGETLNNKKRVSMALKEIGIAYKLKKEYKESKNAFDRAYIISQEIGKNDLSAEILYERAILLKKMGDYQNSLEDYLAYFELKDSVKNIEAQRQILEYQTKFETQKASIDLKEKKLELERNQVYLLSSSVTALVLLIIAILLYRSNRARQKSNQKLNEINETVQKQNDEINIQKRRLEDAFVELNNQKNELDINVSTKDKLFSILAHDIKNPLGVIMNYAELLKSHKDLSNAEVSEIVESIYKSSGKLSELLNTILTWSRSQQGLINIKKEKIDLKTEIESATEPLLSWMSEKHISFISIDEPFQIFADKFMVNTIIRNLVHNSIKYTGPGGKISIEAAEDEIFSYMNVSDTGSGISRENLSRIFTGLKDIKNAQSTGLGLKICKDFVEKQGGIISVISEIGNGTTFSIKLPKN